MQLDTPQVGIRNFPDEREAISPWRHRRIVGVLADHGQQLELATSDWNFRQMPPAALIQREYEPLTTGGPRETPYPLLLRVDRPRLAIAQ